MTALRTLLVITLLAVASSAQTAGLNMRLRIMAFSRDAPAAVELIERARANENTKSSAWLAGASWVARGASLVEDWPTAQKYAQEAYDGAMELVEGGAAMERDADLETALGASIEVLGQAAAGLGDRASAIAFLGGERERFRGTPIETRIQKNFLLVGLEGKPMPALEVERFIGAERPIDTDGKVAVFFFWAHWCGDCKAQIPRLERLHERYADQGLTVIGPTRLYGYVAGGRDASPVQEIAYMEDLRQRQEPLPAWMPKPLSTANFMNFGVSTTPTLVIVDRTGIVRQYHPGQMSDQELEAAVQPLL
jgi:thiol-disulfide isomerase/thioredoxin